MRLIIKWFDARLVKYVFHTEDLVREIAYAMDMFLPFEYDKIGNNKLMDGDYEGVRHIIDSHTPKLFYYVFLKDDDTNYQPKELKEICISAIDHLEKISEKKDLFEAIDMVEFYNDLYKKLKINIRYTIDLTIR